MFLSIVHLPKPLFYLIFGDIYTHQEFIMALYDHVCGKKHGDSNAYNPSTQEVGQENSELEGSLSYKINKPVSKTKQANK